MRRRRMRDAPVALQRGTASKHPAYTVRGFQRAVGNGSPVRLYSIHITFRMRYLSVPCSDHGAACTRACREGLSLFLLMGAAPTKKPPLLEQQGLWSLSIHP